MAEFIYQMKNVRKAHGDKVILDRINLSIEDGSFTVMIGPSGCGKTTLLRIIAGIGPQTSGRVFLDGEDISGLPPAKRNVAMVFQNYNLFRNKTALENLTEPLIRVCRMPAKEAQKRAAEILGQVGLEDKLKAYPSQLSGGQQQRVGIARAMALHPTVMLFDEPTSSLDPQWVGEVLEVIRALIRAHNTTMLLVTHEMKFAQEAADRILFMDEGRIVEDTTPQQFFTCPQHPKAISFLKHIHV